MKGSIRFNNDINVEVDVDPAAEEGARLSSAKNLVDGQELGVGGGSDLPVVTADDAGKGLIVDSQGEWAAEEYPGWDVVIKIVGTSSLLPDNTISIIKGNYDACSDKLLSKSPVSAIAIWDVSPFSIQTLQTIFTVLELSGPQINFQIYPMSLTPSSAIWTSDGTIMWD